jgi:hypothetical protein
MELIEYLPTISNNQILPNIHQITDQVDIPSMPKELYLDNLDYSLTG